MNQTKPKPETTTPRGTKASPMLFAPYEAYYAYNSNDDCRHHSQSRSETPIFHTPK